ncbi:hypothetical protein AAFF_G00393580 [Aldrovandia affinis]|uniref:Uncharacterized protein n=1 Tax=Aldrovandia affinis TaxID=143900 RepID=A0AAD7WLM2_9TELE|nr:hypothetical protein AAFF_G00393580 [Aldrovandia affinis]
MGSAPRTDRWSRRVTAPAWPRVLALSSGTKVAPRRPPSDRGPVRTAQPLQTPPSDASKDDPVRASSRIARPGRRSRATELRRQRLPFALPRLGDSRTTARSVATGPARLSLWLFWRFRVQGVLNNRIAKACSRQTLGEMTLDFHAVPGG